MYTQSALGLWGHVWCRETSPICPNHMQPDASTSLPVPLLSPAVVCMTVLGGDGKSGETEPIRQNCRRVRFANYVLFLSVFSVTLGYTDSLWHSPGSGPIK